MVLPVPAVLLACILIVPEQLELSLAIILFTGYLTDLLAGPYLMLSMAELVRYLSTTNPEESSSTPRHPVGFADRMYEWMQGLHGTNLDLPETMFKSLTRSRKTATERLLPMHIWPYPDQTIDK